MLRVGHCHPCVLGGKQYDRFRYFGVPDPILGVTMAQSLSAVRKRFVQIATAGLCRRRVKGLLHAGASHLDIQLLPLGKRLVNVVGQQAPIVGRELARPGLDKRMLSLLIQ